VLGEVALELNPRALAAERDGTRLRVGFRGGANASELRSFLGLDLRIQGSSNGGFVADFEHPGVVPSSPRARALLAAALARALPARPPRLLAVLNVTPDSFSDGGLWDDPGRAVARGLELIAEGADALDVGGESTRPGSQPVELEEERRRVIPVIRELARQTKTMLSVDTTKAVLAAEALDAGASMVNDVSAGRFDPEMISLVARRECAFALMHMQGTPRDMQEAPSYVDVVDEVLAFLRERASVAWRAGIAPERLLVDPGIGFGKSLEHNLQLFARLAELRSLGLGLLVGPSRKSFIAKLDAREGLKPQHGPAAARERIGGTAAAVACCVVAGADMLRVHDVRIMSEALRVARAIALA
ncbi:MAG TPA: dihydropteroate synthase, partial [Planctomycetota bacterium]|nr:dihydropteroate synthase [Planctomycetota bacterium]